MSDRLNQFLSDDANFEAVAFHDPRAVAHRAKVAANHQRRMTAQAREAAKAAGKASAFAIGQTLLGARNMIGTVVAIENEFVVVDISGSHRKFHASALRAA